MIELYSGTPGSGKSYHACRRIIDAFRMNKNVIANFPVKPGKRYLWKKRSPYRGAGYFEYVPNHELTVKFLLEFSKQAHIPKKEHQTLVVIDEAGHVFNSRTWQDKDRLHWLNFFALHRHFGFDFILVAQQDIMLDKQIRSLIEFEVHHRSVKSSGLVGFVMLLAGNFIAVTTYYGNKMNIGSEFIRYRKSVGEIYDTFAVFNDLYDVEDLILGNSGGEKNLQSELALEVGR